MNKTELTKLLHKEYHTTFKNIFGEKGFKRFKTNNYIRITTDDIVHEIDIQKHRWDTRFTFNINVFPLFLESDTMYYAFGGIRSGMFKTGNDFWWQYSTEIEMKHSLSDALELFQNTILPWFDRLNNVYDLYAYLQSPDHLFIPYRFHPGDNSHKKEKAYILLKTGDVQQAYKLLDAELKKEIQSYETVNHYLDEVTQQNYTKFKIDQHKYKFS